MSKSHPEQIASGVVRHSPRTNSSTPGSAWNRRFVLALQTSTRVRPPGETPPAQPDADLLQIDQLKQVFTDNIGKTTDVLKMVLAQATSSGLALLAWLADRSR